MSALPQKEDFGKRYRLPDNNNFPNSLFSSVREGLARIILYALLVVGLAEFIKWDATQFVGDLKFSEQSYTEFGQSFLLILSCGLLLYLYRTQSPVRYTALLLLGLLSAAFFREQDVYFENYLGNGTWQIPVYTLLIVVLTTIWKNRHSFARELTLYTHSTAFGVFLGGLLTTFVFSRLYGRKTFWYSVMGEDYFRAVKNAGEECLELYGYLFLFISCVELAILSKKLLTTNLNESFSEIRQLLRQPAIHPENLHQD
jgi:hypothetical protein